MADQLSSIVNSMTPLEQARYYSKREEQDKAREAATTAAKSAIAQKEFSTAKEIADQYSIPSEMINPYVEDRIKYHITKFNPECASALAEIFGVPEMFESTKRESLDSLLDSLFSENIKQRITGHTSYFEMGSFIESRSVKITAMVDEFGLDADSVAKRVVMDAKRLYDALMSQEYEKDYTYHAFSNLDRSVPSFEKALMVATAFLSKETDLVVKAAQAVYTEEMKIATQILEKQHLSAENHYCFQDKNTRQLVYSALYNAVGIAEKHLERHQVIDAAKPLASLLINEYYSEPMEGAIQLITRLGLESELGEYILQAREKIFGFHFGFAMENSHHTTPNPEKAESLLRKAREDGLRPDLLLESANEVFNAYMRSVGYRLNGSIDTNEHYLKESVSALKLAEDFGLSDDCIARAATAQVHILVQKQDYPHAVEIAEKYKLPETTELRDIVTTLSP